VINAEAERIVTATLREHGVSVRVTLRPGAAATEATPKAIRPAISGSAAELAENHPIVQQARQLFHAEISNVIDLRDKN
jgi:DNA polymerase-3 subunit gamma/tau